MSGKLPIADCRLPIDFGAVALCCDSRRQARSGFSLVELMVAMSLLTLIVVALMAVFSSTQRAFRASVTQTDILEGSRAALDLMSTDLRSMTPSYGQSNSVFAANGLLNLSAPANGPVNFFVEPNVGLNGLVACPLLLQSLPGTSSASVLRTNVLNYFFILGRQNTQWIGIGYVVNATNSVPLFPLYRFYSEANIAVPPFLLFSNFMSAVELCQWTNMSHVMDGVVHLSLRAYDLKGFWMTNNFQWDQEQSVTNANAIFTARYGGEVGGYMYSNMVPAEVEIQMGVLEDRTLQRAESLGSGQVPALTVPQWNYLTNQSGHVHLFRERVAIPNVDTSAYQ